MEVERLILAAVFTSIVALMLWARIYFFKVDSYSSKLISYINDPAVFAQMGGFYYFLANGKVFFLNWWIGLLLYLSGITIFIWAMVSAKTLGFANSDRDGELVTGGPYAIVRHPCYLSYILFWLGNCSLFGVPIMWISFMVLLLMYIYSARNEEDFMLRSQLGDEYRNYKSNVGMFIPRIPQKPTNTR